MLPYLIKRILLLPLTLFVVSLLAFWISSKGPVDPILRECPNALDFTPGSSARSMRDCRQRVARRYQLDLPLFYLNIRSAAESDTLYRILDPHIREMATRTAHRYGNWSRVQDYLRSLQTLQDQIAKVRRRQDHPDLARSYALSSRLMRSDDPLLTRRYLAQLDSLIVPGDELLASAFEQVNVALDRLIRDQQSWKVFIPILDIHLTQNRYHRWLTGMILRGDFGRSYNGGRKIGDRIWALFRWSMLFALLSAAIAYGISVPLGILAARKKDSGLDKGLGIVTFALDAMPSFWVATLLLMLFANPLLFDWFPASFNIPFPTVRDQWLRMVLPLIAYSYGALAYLSRTMRASMLEVMNQDYIRTAYAKGLSQRAVLWRHALKNSLLPMVTLFVGIFPAILSGSVVLESIFGIPGMGREILRASLENDMPMIMVIFTLTAFLTITGYLVADILYALLNPRIRFGNPR